MTKPPLFVELCAGTAALSLRLASRHARPPVSRMGAKTGYANAILRAMGLRAGLGAERYLWAEPDPGCRLLLHAYTDRALALAAAEIIRGWKDEDPRALWERLRAEGPARCPPVEAREVGRHVWVHGRSFCTTGNSFMPEVSSNGVEVWNAHPPEYFADAVAALPTLPATILPDARDVDPREVARWALGEAWTNGGRYMGPDRPSACHPTGWVASITADGLSNRFDRLPPLPATILPDALPIAPRPAVVYMDPPYVGTTGYAATLSRAEVCTLAERWASAGALVVISEAEPIEALTGWHHVEITSERVGQKRTFSKQQREWLTMSRAPTWTPAVQVGLFAVAR